MTSRQQGRRFVSIQSNRVESTTFLTHPQSPDALYFLSLAQIDFLYDESTARDTTRVDSIESSRIDNIFNPPSKPRCAVFSKSRANRLPVWQIDSKGHDSSRVDRIASNGHHFQPTLRAQMRYIFQVSRKSTSGMTNRQRGTQFVTIRSNRVESTAFSTHPQSPDALYFLSLAQIGFRYDESTARVTLRHDSIESRRIDNIFNPPSEPRCAIFSKSRANRLPVWRIDSKRHNSSRFDNIFDPPSKPRYAIFSKSRANRLPVWRVDSKGDDSSRFDRITSNRQHFQPTLKAQMRYIF